MTDLPPNSLTNRFSLGPWQVDVSLDEVRGRGQVHKLEPRAMRLLAALAQARGELVLADTLLATVWPGLIVTPSSLYDAVAQLRKVLGSEHIATVARKGYRLVTTVDPQLAEGDAPAAVPVANSPGATEPRLGPRSVAVLPFGGHGLDESFSFLTESLTGALIAELSRQPGLAVVALGTMLTFGQRRPPPQQLSEQLGVRFVVEGQLELRADQLHVGVQVVDAQHGTQTWADALTLPANAWHETASVVIGRLARALQFELNGLASQAPTMAHDVDIDARALAAQAWVQLFARAQTPETNERAVRLARSALALAPELSQAWMCLAYCDWRAGHYGWGSEARDEQLARALAQAERAVALDPRDPDAHYVLALATRFRGQAGRGEEALRHCLRLASSYAPAHGLLAQFCVRRGRVKEAQSHCDSAFALSPLEPLRALWHSVRAEAYLATEDPKGALEECQRGMAVNPGFVQTYLFGAAAAWRLGTTELARDWLTELRSKPAFSTLASVRQILRPTYDPLALDQFDNLVQVLREAGLPEH